MRHADRMGSVFGKGSVVDDPGLNRAVPLDLGQHHLAHLGQHHLVRPRAFRHEMQQRLVLGADTLRRRRCCDRLNALPFAGQKQTRAIVAHRPDPGRMPDHFRKPIEIARETPCAVAPLRFAHAASRLKEPVKSLIPRGRGLWQSD